MVNCQTSGSLLGHIERGREIVMRKLKVKEAEVLGIERFMKAFSSRLPEHGGAGI
jgi:hypothetical protein